MPIFEDFVRFVRNIFNTNEFIPLHEPKFIGNEKEYVMDAINSTFVSSVGAYVDRFEEEIAKVAGTQHAVATVNGTAALHAAMATVGVEQGDEVITQPMTFVATANAIRYTGADPVFVDVDCDTMSLSPDKLEEFIQKKTYQGKDGHLYNISTWKRIAACLPMHTFGFPGKIDKIKAICDRCEVMLIEDAAESLGSFYKDKHTGSFGSIGAFSFNGNKTITSGGGGAIVTNNEVLAKKAKHITTTARRRHQWEFSHDQLGYNYRMPNLNAAFACAQLEMLQQFVENKRQTAKEYEQFFANTPYSFFTEDTNSYANYWLNTILVNDIEERNALLNYTNDNGVMTRPVWKLMHKLPMYKDCSHGDLSNAEWLEDRIVNLPSSVIL